SEYRIDQGMQELRNAVDRAEDLPDEAKTPSVIEIDVAVFPVCILGLSGDYPMMQLQDIAEDVAAILEDIEGVSEVDIRGKREREIWIELNPHRMSTYGISVPMVAETIAKRAKNLPGGTVEMGYHETAIRMVGEPESPERLGNLALKSTDGGTVFLKDIAGIKPALEKPGVLSFIEKKNALVLAVKRKKNVNMIHIVDQVKAMAKDFDTQYPGLKTTIFFDQSRVIKKRISELQNNALLGMIAVFIILWISMGHRNAIFASIGIPVSFLLTFIFMKCFHPSIDGVTLFALILVLGVIVDDAIVVLENIFRYIERGVPTARATLEGSREVLGPVLASVSTNMAAFFPLLFMIKGVIGRYIAILPKIVLFALAASLLEVFFMLPSHVVELTSTKAADKAASKKGRDVFTPFRKMYYPYLKMILRHRYISVFVIILSTMLAFYLYFQTDFEMFPKSDSFPRFNIHFDLPVGSTLERTRQTLMTLSDRVRKGIGADLEAPIAFAGMKEVNYEPIFGTHHGMISVILKPHGERRREVVEIMESVRAVVEQTLYSKGATAVVLERLLEGPQVGYDVDLKIQSTDWETSAIIARQIQGEMAKHYGIVDIRDDYSRQKQFMEITVDEAKAKSLGIDQEHLVMAVQAAFHGLKVATYNRGEEEQDIKLKYLADYRNNFDDLMNLRLSVSEAGVIPLKEVAFIRMKPGFQNIYHYNGKQTVRVTANIQSIQTVDKGLSGFLSNFTGEKMTAVKANRIARTYFDRIKVNFPGARMIAGGMQEETNTSLRELQGAAILALFLIFFILALQFNSFTQPFIIMITIPFVTLGVMIGLLVSGNPLTFVTLIGLLTLCGIVVNDSLVLIDFINRYWKEHPKKLYLAILRACHVRMRPIMLTSLTTIFGLAPMAIGIGGKSIFWAPLATAIMWGLGFATLLILTMVPAYYAILQDIRYVLVHRRRRKADLIKEIEEAFQCEEVRPYLRSYQKE
ncbi:MAG: efflux RND transporter permease subunit, partial [Deltaproteobacteria bacterium]|nr:efflux RND transporter permease subunit [Deltaproteobacteria bacterium]